MTTHNQPNDTAAVLSNSTQTMAVLGGKSLITQVKDMIANLETIEDGLTKALAFYQKNTEVFTLFLDAYNSQDIVTRNLADKVLQYDVNLDWQDIDQIRKERKPLLPVVGMSATLSVGSDCYAYTVVSVTPSQKTFIMALDNAKRIDKNGLSENQEYEHTPNPDGVKRTVRLTKTGWKTGGQRVTLGFKHTYDDPSF